MGFTAPAVFWLVGILGLIAALAGGRVTAGGVHLPAMTGRSVRAGVAAVSVLSLLLGLLLFFDRGSETAGATGEPGSASHTASGTHGRPAAPSTGPAAVVADVVRWHGNIGLNVDGSMLDEIPPKAAVGQTGDVAFYYIYMAIDTYTGNRDGISRWTGAARPTRQACSDLIDTHPGSEVGSIHKGVQICVRTAQSRIALLRVLAVNGDVVELDVTVWELP